MESNRNSLDIPVSKTSSVISSSVMSNRSTFHEGQSARNSMDLIQGTTQQFPQKNRKPELIADVRLQRQRWDAFFEPQYTFGAIIHGSTEPTDNENLHKKNIDKLVDGGNHLLGQQHKSPRPISVAAMEMSLKSERSSMDGSNPESTFMSPTLPCIKDARLDLDKSVWGPRDEQSLFERLEMLKKMRQQQVGTDSNSTVDNNTAIATAAAASEENQLDQDTDVTSATNKLQGAARWKRHLSEKVKQICKEAKQENEFDRRSSSSSNSSVSSNSDIEKADFQNGAVDEEQGEQTAAGKKKATTSCRRSFLCFALGFLFPPLWLFGAFYFSSYANKQTSASRRVDRIWRRRSRIAFGIFAITLMIVLVVSFVVKPGSVGWRASRMEADPPLV